MNSQNIPPSLTLPSLPSLKLTRAVEADPRCKAIETLLKKDCRPLWVKSTLKVAHIPLLPSLETCLKSLLHRSQLERGIEHIDELLNSEQKGLAILQKKQGTQPSHRVSRLILLSNDGSERFYRECEKTLLRNSDRVMLLHINEPSTRLAESLLGVSHKPLKALLVSDRDAVTAVLFSLVEELSQS